MEFDEILAQIQRICIELGVAHLYLFGSYATGTATEESDIDIIVKGCNDIGYLEERLAAIMTLKRIDVFDYDQCRNVFLKEDMDKYGVRIY